jgi:hypothetical protein
MMMLILRQFQGFYKSQVLCCATFPGTIKVAPGGDIDAVDLNKKDTRIFLRFCPGRSWFFNLMIL